MENNINAYCTICNQGYHLCMSCQDSKINPWRSIVDSIEHYKIFIIIRDYENGYINKDEASKQLNQRDLTGLETFVPEVKAKIEEIMEVKTIQINNESVEVNGKVINKSVSSSKRTK